MNENDLIAVEGRSHFIGDPNTFADVKALVDCVRQLSEEVAHLRVQLAGCSVIALGHDKDLPQTAYGWSCAFEDVRKLRLEVERLRERVRDEPQPV